MMTAAAIWPTLGLLKWPLTVTGAVLVFGLSTEGTLSLVANNAHRLTSPITGRTDINVPAVRQIGNLQPAIVVKTDVKSESTEAPTQVAAISAPTDPLSLKVAVQTAEPLDGAIMRQGRIGSSAVNVRSGPSSSSAKLAVLAAGTPVRLGDGEGGWVHISYDGGEGWVYSDYLAGSLAVSGRNADSTAAKSSKLKTAEAGSRIVARESPQSGATSLFRLEPGERVQILERQGKWLKVRTASGDAGWIRAK